MSIDTSVNKTKVISMGGDHNMLKRIFFMIIVLQALFIGVCSANSGRLADIGAEVFRGKMVESTNSFVSGLEIKKLSVGMAKLYPGTTLYTFFMFDNMNTDKVVSVSVFVNQEGYIDAIGIAGSGASESSRAFSTNIVEESMMAIGLSNDDINCLTTKGIQGKKYHGVVFSENMGRDVYYTFWRGPNAFHSSIIYRMSYTDRGNLFRAS